MQSLFDQINSEPGNPDDLAHRWQQIPASATWHRTLAVYADNPAAGYGFAGRDNWDEPGHFTISVVVDRASQGTGIGSALLADAIAFVGSHDGSVLHGRVYENDPQSLEWAKARGAVVQRHSYESALDLATFEPARFSGVPQGLQARGIRLTTLADLPPEAGRQLYDLWARTAHDNPSYRGGGDPPFEQWSKWVLQNPNMPLDCLIVAMDGDRIVGTTGLLRQNNGSYYTDYTGVDREYRGRGIALALKLFSIRKALAAGAPYMRTNNDSTNAPMLAVNRKLGYTPRPGVFMVDLAI